MACFCADVPLRTYYLFLPRNFKFGRLHKMDLVVAYQETTFSNKIGGGWTSGAYQIFWDPPPLIISATTEASNFKFGTQLGFGE